MRILAALLFSLAACDRPLPPAKLAVIAPLTGDLAADGQGMSHAVSLAIEDERAAGRLTRNVQVVLLDDKAQPEQAAAAAKQAAEDPAVFAVVGPLNSGGAILAARVLAPESVPMITPSATASELTLQQERPQWPGARVAFRLPPSDAVQGDSDAEYARRRLGLKRIAVVHDGTPYGFGLADAFRKGFEARGGRVALVEAIEPRRDDYRDAARRLAAAAPDGVFYGGVYIEAGRLLKAARAAGYRGAYFSGDGAKSDDFFRYAGPAAEGAYLSVSGVALEALPSASDFVARYTKRWNVPPRTFDHYAYEAARIALWALAKTGGDRKEEVDAIRSTPHEAMMGTFIFDAKGDSLKSLITMMRADAKNRRFVSAY